MNEMCCYNFYVAIKHVSDLEANFNNYEDKINEQFHHAV